MLSLWNSFIEHTTLPPLTGKVRTLVLVRYDLYLYVLHADVICRVPKCYLLHNTGARGDC